MVYTPPIITITAAGTAKQLSSTLPTTVSATTPLNLLNPRCDWVTVNAPSSNAANIVVGGVDPTSTSTPLKTGISGPNKIGIEIAKGTSYTFPMVSEATMYDLTQMFVDAETSNDKASVTYGRR